MCYSSDPHKSDILSYDKPFLNYEIVFCLAKHYWHATSSGYTASQYSCHCCYANRLTENARASRLFIIVTELIELFAFYVGDTQFET